MVNNSSGKCMHATKRGKNVGRALMEKMRHVNKLISCKNIYAKTLNGRFAVVVFQIWDNVANNAIAFMIY